MTLVKVLTELGAYPVLKRGRPCLYETPDEALKVQRAQMNVSQKRRRLLKKEALEAGEPEPMFKPGRPRLYATEAEALTAKKLMQKACYTRYKDNVRQATEAFLASKREQVESEEQQ